MFYHLLGIVLCALFVAITSWIIYGWCNSINYDEVGLRRFWGKLEPKIRYPGLCFVPPLPNVDLVKVPTEMFELQYDADLGQRHEIFSSDGQELGFDGTAFVRFPYNQAKPLVKMLEAGVPLTEAELARQLEDVIIAKARIVLSKRSYRQLINGDEYAKISEEITGLLREKNGVLDRLGILGLDVTKSNPGTGSINFEIEVIKIHEELRRKLERVQTAELDIQVAKSEAQAGAIKADELTLAMNTWVIGHVNCELDPGEDPDLGKARIAGLVMATRDRLIASGDYDKHEKNVKDFLLAKSGHLNVARVEAGAPDGTPLNGGLGELAVLATLFGRPIGNPPPKNGGNRPPK